MTELNLRPVEKEEQTHPEEEQIHLLETPESASSSFYIQPTSSGPPETCGDCSPLRPPFPADV